MNDLELIKALDSLSAKIQHGIDKETIFEGDLTGPAFQLLDIAAMLIRGEHQPGSFSSAAIKVDADALADVVTELRDLAAREADLEARAAEEAEEFAATTKGK